MLALLPATSVCGQQLLREALHRKHYKVYKESMSHFNANTNKSEELFASEVNYLLTMYAGGMQLYRVSKYKPMLSNKGGFPVCQFTGLKYLSHSYSADMLVESYRGVYQAYPGGAVPPLQGIPNPSSVEVSWSPDTQGSRSIQVYWFYGPRKKPATLFGQSCFMYTLECKQLD